MARAMATRCCCPPESCEGMCFMREARPTSSRALVMRALERVGVAHRARHLPGQLSGGQQQRVAVARAVVGDPAILLADEPTGDLDRKSGLAVLDLFSRLHRDFGKTILMVTHDPAAAERATAVRKLEKGKLV